MSPQAFIDYPYKDCTDTVCRQTDPLVTQRLVAHSAFYCETEAATSDAFSDASDQLCISGAPSVEKPAGRRSMIIPAFMP
jgi:hypothetical protein